MSKTTSFSDHLTTESRQLLAEIAFLASGYGLRKQATLIFKFLEKVANGQVYPTVGQALVYLNQGDVDKAVQLLNKRINSKEQTAPEELATLRCFLGLAQTMSGANEESRKQLDLACSDKSSSPEVKKLARSLIDQQLSKR